jgi:hypothetical protein
MPETTCMTLPISDRAVHIARGLRATGRAVSRRGSFEVDRRYVRLDRVRGAYYWLALDGSRLMRGEEIDDLDELQPSFVDAMARAGARSSMAGLVSCLDARTLSASAWDSMTGAENWTILPHIHTGFVVGS